MKLAQNHAPAQTSPYVLDHIRIAGHHGPYLMTGFHQNMFPLELYVPGWLSPIHTYPNIYVILTYQVP